MFRANAHQDTALPRGDGEVTRQVCKLHRASLLPFSHLFDSLLTSNSAMPETCTVCTLVLRRQLIQGHPLYLQLFCIFKTVNQAHLQGNLSSILSGTALLTNLRKALRWKIEWQTLERCT